MNWVCPYCSQMIEGLDDEELLMSINAHLEKHRPFFQKLINKIIGKKKQQNELERVV